MNSKNFKQFSLKKRVTSFKYAFNGLKIMIASQHNAWIHLLAIVMVILAGFYFDVSTFEWALLFFAIGMVFTSELFNTAIEFLVDLVSPENQKKAGQIKDLAAGGVLFSAIISVVIGVIVFWPKIYCFLFK